MQDFQPVPGIPGRIFAGADAPTGRHRNYPSSSATSSRAQSQQQQQHPPAPVKCPRCESTNTKFCYYNNYNLSQPRHFCKSCRRYWTKGGVLRNVPVGGGCRKSSKRPSKPKPAKPRSKPASAAPSRSSSDSSSTLTAAPAPAPAPILDPPVFPEAFDFADPGPLPGFRADPDPELNGLDWGAGASAVDSGSLFDITSSVDPAVYWNQSHWGDADPSLYLP